MKLDGFSSQFANQPLKSSEIRSGSTLTSEQAKAIGDTLEHKVIGLSRKPELSRDEARFLERTADLSARNIVYLYDSNAAQLSPETAKALTSRANILVGIANETGNRSNAAEHNQEGSTDTDTSAQLKQALANVIGGTESIGVISRPYLRPNVEDFAQTAVTAFSELAASAPDGGLTIDDYLAGNLQNMLAFYERAEDANSAPAPGDIGRIAVGQQ